MEKTKLEYTEGCICYGLSIDGKDPEDMPVEKLREIAHKIVDSIGEDKSKLVSLLINMVQDYCDDYESTDEPCECCGDFICTYKLQV